MSQNLPIAIAEVAESKPKVQIPDGSYTARIYSIIDLGTQENTFDPDKPAKRVFRFSFETPTKTHVWDEEKGPQPFALHKEVNFSLSEPDHTMMSSLSKIFKATKGTLGKGENIFNLLGEVLSIQTETKKTQKGASFSKIIGFSPVSSDIDVSDKKFAPVNEPHTLYLDREWFVHADFNKLPKFLKEKIEASPEYEALKRPVETREEKELPSIDVDDLEVEMPY